VWVPSPSSADANLTTDTLHRCAQDTDEERNLFLGDVMPALQLLGRKLKLEVQYPTPHAHTTPEGWLSPCRSRIPGCAGEFWSSPPEQYLVRGTFRGSQPWDESHRPGAEHHSVCTPPARFSWRRCGGGSGTRPAQRI
jgi:hypothetical protein